jgi:hypothetical protein
LRFSLFASNLSVSNFWSPRINILFHAFTYRSSVPKFRNHQIVVSVTVEPCQVYLFVVPSIFCVSPHHYKSNLWRGNSVFLINRFLDMAKLTALTLLCLSVSTLFCSQLSVFVWK